MPATHSLAKRLSAPHDFWEHWGFAPWSSGQLSGVARTQRFVKDGLLGSIAEYQAWEAILWEPGTEEQRRALWRSRTPLTEVLTQRFLFLLPDPWPERRIRSFLFGLRGYVEFFAYCPGRPGHDKVRDLTGLVDLALALEPYAP